MLNNKQFIIFSAEQYKLDVNDNALNTLSVVSVLKDHNVKYTSVLGKYKGVGEISFKVDAKHENLILELARLYNQHSILFVDSKDNAILQYLSGSIERIGRFREVSKCQAYGLDAYSFINNKYFACI